MSRITFLCSFPKTSATFLLVVIVESTIPWLAILKLNELAAGDPPGSRLGLEKARELSHKFSIVCLKVVDMSANCLIASS